MKAIILISMALIFASSVCAAPEDDFLKLGKECLNTGKYDKAEQVFVRAVKINPANADAQKGLGIAYFHLGNNEYATNVDLLYKSVGFLLEAVRLSPEPDSLYYLGLALLNLGNKDESIKVCNSLQQMDAEKAKLLSGKIADFKEPERYHYLQNEHNLNEERKEQLRDVAEQQRQEQMQKEQAKIEKARAEQKWKERMVSEIEDARSAAQEAARRAAWAETAANEARRSRPSIINDLANPPFPSSVHVPSGGYVTPGGQVILY